MTILIEEAPDPDKVRLILQSTPLEGFPGYYSWLVIARKRDDVKDEVDKIQTIADATSFTKPRLITNAENPYHRWWWSEGFSRTSQEK